MAQRSLRAIFGENLRRLRTEHRLSQEKAAEAAEISRQYLSMLELGDAAATIEVLEKLARAYGVTPAELVTEHLKPE